MDIQRFYQSLSAFSSDLQGVRDLENQAVAMRRSLIERLKSTQPGSQLKADHPLQQINVNLKERLNVVMQQAEDSWEDGQAQRELSDRYQDRTLLLVCGKVNSGKSSFINFLLELFEDMEKRRFHLVDGQVEELEGKFKEGCVETTRSIQWVEIGERLVLMDSPGMHSVTPENEALARQFLDAADGMLWLSNSISPGQVEELQVLKEELKAGKPLLPVITQSDIAEEDEDENENIIHVLQPKADKDRQDQEQDVRARANEFLQQVESPAELRNPVSISVHYQQQASQAEADSTADISHASGMARMIDELVWLVEQARTYKPRKAKQQMAGYLRRELVEPISQRLSQDFDQLQTMLEHERRQLINAKGEITQDVIFHLQEMLPGMVERHRHQRDAKGLEKELRTTMTQQLQEATAEHMERSLYSIKNTLDDVSPMPLNDFEAIHGYARETSGSAAAAGTSAAAATAGGALGFFLGGPVGAAAGGALGGALGGFFGKSMIVETRWVKTDTGEVDSSETLRSAMQSVDATVPGLVDDSMDQLITAITDSDRYITELQGTLERFEPEIETLLADGESADAVTV